MKILAIETSCDETGLALLDARGGLSAPKFTVLANLVASQIKIHRPFGGVVPNLAKREHLKNLPLLYKELVGDGGGAAAARFWKTIDLVTVTVGPGLEPALWTGVEFAKSLAKKWKKPLVGANHLEGHLYSFLLPPADGATGTPTKAKAAAKAGVKPTAAKATKFSARQIFPAVALIVSGGHTILLRMESFSKWRRLGETRDDAVGEAFDKVARMLDLRYPGGPEIEKLARRGDGAAIDFPRPMLNSPHGGKKNYDFSFSGLKTAVLYYMRDRKVSKASGTRSRSRVSDADVAASFQEAAVDVLATKATRAAREFGARSILLSGGVAANKALRARFHAVSKKIPCRFLVPEFAYNLDNAAMIGAAGYMAHLRKKKYKIAARGDLMI